jgi:hypothetical protein
VVPTNAKTIIKHNVTKHSTTSSPYTLPFITKKENTTTLTADTGASSTYAVVTNAAVRNITVATNPIDVRLPNKSQMRNTHEGYLDIPQLPDWARKAYLFQDMQTSLLSIGQLCDAGCIAIFDNEQVSILLNNQIILQGKRDLRTGLWNVNLPTTTEKEPYPDQTSFSMPPCLLSPQKHLENA